MRPAGGVLDQITETYRTEQVHLVQDKCDFEWVMNFLYILCCRITRN